MAKKITLTCAFDAQKIDAMRTFAAEKNVDLDAELAKFLERKYVQLVPKNVRQYIAGLNGALLKSAAKEVTAPVSETVKDKSSTAENTASSPLSHGDSSGGYWQ